MLGGQNVLQAETTISHQTQMENPMSGVKTTVAGLTYSAGHVAQASAASQSVQGTHTLVLLHCNEIIKALNLLLASMPGGDPNITVVTAQIAALS
jgi:hypothetical protein